MARSSGRNWREGLVNAGKGVSESGYHEGSVRLTKFCRMIFQVLLHDADVLAAGWG